MKKNTFKWYSIISGTVLILLLLLIFVLIPCPTTPQLNFFRILIAIAAGAFAATLSGTINIKNDFIIATGSIAVLALVYYVNPAGWNDASDCSIQNTKATVYVDEKLTQDVVVTIPDLSQRFYTDEFGNFNIEYATTQLNFPININFKYKDVLDTTVTVSEKFKRKVEFKLKSNKKGSGGFSSTNNSITYSLNDLNINLSLLKEPLEEGMEDADVVTYIFKNENDTVYILPDSKLINQIKKKEVVTWLVDAEVSLIPRLPVLDIKITNNQEDAMVLNEFVLDIFSSKEINEAILIPIGLSEIAFINMGWGNAKDVSIDFNVVPFKTYTSWKKETYNFHFNVPIISQTKENSSYISYDIGELLNLPPRAFELGELVFDDPKYEKQYKELVGDFDKGGMAYGTISYTEENGKRKTQKFETFFEIAGGFGLGLEISSKYNAFLKSNGENYSVAVPISQGIKPKDFDRFTVKIASSQTSNHIFKVQILYSGKKIELPFVFSLEFFNTPIHKDYQKKIKP
jgi:hypothetical protein